MKLGFSLIELMVVIAIIALLAAVAVPSYAEYVDRTRAAEIMTLSSKALTEWAENNALGNTQPGLDNTDLGDYITSINYGTSTVVVTTNANSELPTAMQNLAITFTATESTGGISWACTVPSASGAASYLDECEGV